MLQIQFPEPQFRIEERDGRRMIFDQLRRRWLVLTPEEWVRQNFVNYLLRQLAYPRALIALEKQIRLGEMLKRFDILVYDPAHQPWLMVECKAPAIPLSEDTLQQLLRYQMALPVSYLIISNGQQTMGWKKEGKELILLETMPAFPEL
jgi:hypothetical protein